MALNNPIGNPLEPHDRPQFIAESPVMTSAPEIGTPEFRTLGPVDDSMIGGTARAASVEFAADATGLAGADADESAGRRHLAWCPTTSTTCSTRSRSSGRTAHCVRRPIPRRSSRKRVDRHVRPNASARAARSRRNAWSMRSTTTNASVSGAAVGARARRIKRGII